MPPSYYDAVLVLSDGRHFWGKSVGEREDRIGEVCFTTGSTGYQHTITDPSFAGQIIVFAFPHIGNIGVNHKDFECTKPLAKGIVVRDVSQASHISSQEDFTLWMKLNKLSGISDVDTRALTIHLRKHGTLNGIIHHFDDPSSVNVAMLQTCANKQISPVIATHLTYLEDYRESHNGCLKACVVDAGAKHGILRTLTTLGCAVDVVAAKDDFATRVLALNPHGVVISNGPGNPADVPYKSIEQLRILLDSGIPMLGICLGHQLISSAVGAKTVKMLHGHRGSNHPVYNIARQSVEITSQNHGFTVDSQTLPANAEVTHVSLFDKTVEGIRLTDRPVFSVQYHPEGCPGPDDSQYIFKDFISLMQRTAR